MPNEAALPLDVSPDSEDHSLILQFLAGDAGAFETLFRKYQGRFLSVARRFLGDEEEAEDVTQETFVDIYHGLRHFRRGAAFQTWAYRILVRKCGERSRRRARRRQFSASSAALQELPAPDALPPADSILIRQALQELPADARMTLILKYYEQLSSEEIAEVLGCNVGQAKMRAHRAKNALKNLLKPMWGSEKEKDA